MLLLGLLAGALNVSSDGQIVAGRPLPPDQYELRLTQECGREKLVVRGFGHAAPADRRATALMNGRPVRGHLAPQLIADLSRRRAVYRLIGLCRNDQRGIWLRIHIADLEEQEPRFFAGNAYIRGSEVISYDLRPISPESFWFR